MGLATFIQGLYANTIVIHLSIKYINYHYFLIVKGLAIYIEMQ